MQNYGDKNGSSYVSSKSIFLFLAALYLSWPSAFQTNPLHCRLRSPVICNNRCRSFHVVTLAIVSLTTSSNDRQIVAKGISWSSFPKQPMGPGANADWVEHLQGWFLAGSSSSKILLNTKTVLMLHSLYVEQYTMKFSHKPFIPKKT